MRICSESAAFHAWLTRHYHEQYRPLSRFRIPPSAVAGTPETHEPRGVLDDVIRRDGTAGDVIG
jgi:hypothetical protein